MASDCQAQPIPATARTARRGAHGLRRGRRSHAGPDILRGASSRRLEQAGGEGFEVLDGNGETLSAVGAGDVHAEAAPFKI